MCPLVENPDLVYHKTGYPQSPTHSRLAECGSRQAIKARPDHPDRVVSPTGGFSINMQQVAQAADRPICNEVQQQVAPVCVTGTGTLAWAVDTLILPWEDLDACAFPPVAILGKVVEKLQDHPCHRIILIAPGWPNMPWFWDLVAMSSQNPPQPAKSTQPSNTALQSDSSRGSAQLKSACLAPRASAIKEQGFSEAVAARIEAPQRGSTRSVYEASGPFLQNGSSVTRWTSGHPL